MYNILNFIYYKNKKEFNDKKRLIISNDKDYIFSYIEDKIYLMI